MTDKKYLPWEFYPTIWKTKSSWFSWLRGGIRRSLWNKSPIKLEYIKKHRKRIANPNPKGKVETVWGGCCGLCGNDFVIAQLDVDHKQGNHSLNELSDIQSFIENIVLVTEDDLQFACKTCHKIKNQQERKGISFKEASYEKIAIDLEKKKLVSVWLKEKGLTPASNAKLRRQQIIDLLREEKENE
jgi:5-methylcytosine-specific restriction endonuclease McrA